MSYAIRHEIEVIALPFAMQSATESKIFSHIVSLANENGIIVVGSAGDDGANAEMNNGIFFERDYAFGEDELIDEMLITKEGGSLDNKGNDRGSVLDSIKNVFKSISGNFENATPVANEDPSDNTVENQLPSSANGVTVEYITVRWLSSSTGKDTPAVFDDLELIADVEKAPNQQFQIDFALSGQLPHEPGTIKIEILTSIWLDRENKAYGTLTLAIPEEPETAGEFSWKRKGNKIIITNTKAILAANKIMIQGTFRDMLAPDIIDETVSAPFSATVTVTTPNNEIIGMTSNKIKAKIDTYIKAVYANKTAYNSASKSYDVWREGIPEDILAQLLEVLSEGADPKDYGYIRWYVAGAALGSQPFEMFVEDTIDADNAKQFGAIMLGVSDSYVEGLDTLIDFSNNANTIDMSNMFYGCTNLTTVKFSGKPICNASSVSDMFSGCKKLTVIEGLDAIDFSNNTNTEILVSAMFKDCTSITELDLSSWKTGKSTTVSNMFNGCTNLSSLIGLENFDTSNVKNIVNMFVNCSPLLPLDLGVGI